MPHNPVIRAFVCCDRAVADRNSGMYSLFNVFDAINSPIFPVTQQFYVYLSLVDGRGKVPVKLSLVREDPRAVVCEFAGILTHETPQCAASAAIEFRPKFEAPGAYTFELFVSGDPVAYHPLKVLVSKPPPVIRMI